MAEILELINMYFHLYICFIIFLGYIIILEVAKKERKKEEEENSKLKKEYLEKIKKLYISDNNSKIDLIMEELEEKNIDFIKDYYFRELEYKIKKGK